MGIVIDIVKDEGFRMSGLLFLLWNQFRKRGVCLVSVRILSASGIN